MRLRGLAILAATLVALAACAGDTGETADVAADVLGDAAGATGDVSAADGMVERTADTVPEEDSVIEPEPFIFAVVSDTHVWGGPEHSVSQRLVECLTTLAGLEPAPAAVFVTGDLTDSIPGSSELSGGPLPTFAQIIAESAVPVHPVAGNHDYYAAYSPQFLLTQDRAAADSAMQEALGIEPWYATTLGGVRFLLLNSMQGELWDLSLGLNGSLGLAQLEWLDAQLEAGEPTIIFLHHPPLLLEEPDSAVTFDDVLAAHADTVLAVFAGHLHVFARSELHGVPVFLTADNQTAVAYHHVRVDPARGKVDILNEEEIEYGSVEMELCQPEDHAPVADLSVFAGSVHQLLIGEVVAEPAAFEDYLKDGLNRLPFVLEFDAPGGSELVLPARLTVGRYVGNGVGALPPYVDLAPDVPCLLVDLLLDNPCFVTQPVSFEVEVGQLFDLPLDDDWDIRTRLDKVQLYGRLDDAAEPALVDGLLTLELDLTMTIADLKQVVVDGYCAGEIASCEPGANEMPACPTHPEPDFFEEIPKACDVKVMGFGIRMALTILESMPGGKATMQAEFLSRRPEISDDVAPGAIATDLFSSCEEE